MAGCYVSRLCFEFRSGRLGRESEMPFIQLSDDMAAFITARIERFASESPEQIRWEYRYVAMFKALPLYLGWTETIGIRQNGEVIRWSTEDEYVGTQSVEDHSWLITALISGAKWYPEIQSLIPKRGESDKNCWCANYPRFRSGELICGTCGGIGWLSTYGLSTP
jgi:hypothetical protein